MRGGSILGVAKTKAALARAATVANAASPKAAEEGGKVVAQKMAERAPRDTGELVARIETEADSLGQGATAKVGSTAPYDRFVQKGTRNMGAQPYGEDAARAAAPGVVAAMAKVYKAALDALGG